MFSNGLTRSRTPAISPSISWASRSRSSPTNSPNPPDEKFAGVDWKPGLGNAPVLADSVANFQCRAANRYYGGDHIIFLGAVEAYAYNRKEPLLFARGGYGRFVPPDGDGKSS